MKLLCLLDRSVPLDELAAAVAGAFPGVRRLAVSTIVERLHVAPEEPQWNELEAVAEVWLDDGADVNLASPLPGGRVFSVAERVMQPRPIAEGGWSGLKRMTCVRRKPGVSYTDYLDWYYGHHAPVAAQMGLAGYVINMLPDGSGAPLDSLPMFWFVDAEQHRRAYQPGPSMDARRADADTMVTTPAVFMVREWIGDPAAALAEGANARAG